MLSVRPATLLGLLISLHAACDSPALVVDAAPDRAAAECFSPRERCGADCVDIRSNALHCNGCDRPCGTGLFCMAGACSRSCSLPLRACGTACVDQSTDTDHCGGCDRPCTGDQVCRGGSCVCRTGWIECNGVCVDPSTSREHCGLCNNPCGASEACSDSMCVCSTGNRETACNDMRDDDCDDLVDCADTDCNGSNRSCRTSGGASGSQTCMAGAWSTCTTTTRPDGGVVDSGVRDTGVGMCGSIGGPRNRDRWEGTTDNDVCSRCSDLGAEHANPNYYTPPDTRLDSVDDVADCYKFRVDDTSTRGRLEFFLRRIPSGGDYNVYVYRGLSACTAGTPLLRGEEPDENEEHLLLEETTEGPDWSADYYVIVTRERGYSCTLDYYLTVHGRI